MEISTFAEMNSTFKQIVLPQVKEGKFYFKKSEYKRASSSFAMAYKYCVELSEIFCDVYKSHKIKNTSQISTDVFDSFQNEFYKIYNDLAKYYSLCCYYDCNFEKSLYIADYIAEDTTASKVVIALSYRHIKPYEENWRYAFSYMKSVEKDKTYISSTKNELEERLFVELMIQLSEIYRIGSEYEKFVLGKYSPYKDLFPDIDKSMQLLISIQEHIIYDSNKLLLSKQLAHYKKKLFGGYKYVW